jgi:hypothetical protein
MMKKGLITSIKASYLKDEIDILLSNSNFKNYKVSENSFGLVIKGEK